MRVCVCKFRPPQWHAGMCERLVEPLAPVFEKLMLTIQSMLKKVPFSVEYEDCSQRDWSGAQHVFASV